MTDEEGERKSDFVLRQTLSLHMTLCDLSSAFEVTIIWQQR